jgi:hypothetical protein
MLKTDNLKDQRHSKRSIHLASFPIISLPKQRRSSRRPNYKTGETLAIEAANYCKYDNYIFTVFRHLGGFCGRNPPDGETLSTVFDRLSRKIQRGKETG